MATALFKRLPAKALSIAFTPRELQVVECICEGDTNRDIAKRLGVSVETVKEHVQHCLRKADARDRTQLAVFCMRGGIVKLNVADIQNDLAKLPRKAHDLLRIARKPR